MKQCKTIILSLTVFSLLAVSAFAGSKNESKQVNQSPQKEKMQIRYTVVSLNNLTMAIDFWHDANLRGDKKEAATRLNEIMQILEEDVRNTAQAVSYAKLEMSYSKEESKQKQSTQMTELEKKYTLQDNRDELNLENRYLKSKRLILQSIKRSESFAYRYRLMADYQQLLRNELELDKVEIAEDLGESSGK